MVCDSGPERNGVYLIRVLLERHCRDDGLVRMRRLESAAPSRITCRQEPMTFQATVFQYAGVPFRLRSVQL